MLKSPLTPARARWEGETLICDDFGDVYFSRAGGLAETHHVFIKGNNLSERFMIADTFCIAETGFGTGLNFFATLQEWRHANSSGWLEYISVEKHPLPADMIRPLAGIYPDLKDIIEKFLTDYPPALAGLHRITFPSERVVLSLYFGDALDVFKNLNASADAWFLDGFTPTLNPDLWHEHLLTEIARLSSPGASVATFTAASSVKKALENNGFKVTKQKGFGKKRDMITAILAGENKPLSKSKETIHIAGAGIAGCTCAFVLAQRGYDVRLYDGKGIGENASKNAGAVLYPRLTADFTLEGRFFTNAYLHSVRFFKNLGLLNQTGVIQRAHDEKKQLWQQKVLSHLSPPLDFITPLEEGFLFPAGGWLDLNRCCRVLSNHKNISFIPDHLHVLPEDGIIILANALGAKKFFPNLSLEPVRGQSIKVYAPSHGINRVITHDGSVVPLDPDTLILGSTFQRGRDDLAPNDSDTDEILAKAATHVPDLKVQKVISAWVGVRVATPQRFPLFGESLENKRIYYTLGHGSHAASTAAYCADIIAAQISDLSFPTEDIDFTRKIEQKAIAAAASS